MIALAASTRQHPPALIVSSSAGFAVQHAAFTPAGDVAYYRDHFFTVTTWDGSPLIGGRAGQSREGEATFAVTPAGDLLAVRRHRGIALHALPSLAPAGRLDDTEGPSMLRFLDERRLLALDGSTLTLWDARSATVLASVATTGTHAFAVSPDERFVVVGRSIGAGHAVHLLPSLSPAFTFGPAAGSTAAIGFSPSGRLLATGDWHNEVLLWDVSGLPSLPPATVLGRHDGWVEALSFVDEHTVVSGGWDGAVMRWDTGAPSAGRRLGEHAGYVTALDVSADRQVVLSAAADGTVCHWDPAAAGVSAPPYQMRHGEGVPRFAMHVPRPGEVVVRVGERSLRWSTAGVLLGPGRIEERTSPAVFPALGLRATWDGPVLLHDRAGAVVGSVPLPAAPVCATAGDHSVLVVLDAAGHLTFWKLVVPRR
ncbi:hypothetical protein OHA72_50950 [Dactylosporangium sp. NBC_01737]|uniref:WD40 repeat domain-containing protein n=1 Tax=Dactylosporangium sp. NBC_01737 TaxID=2975959 RepID=UPI002E128E98|nr:hypothetical protein OHA72_50950 [Dactylosporangium sp. NBC_01737]